MKKKKELTDIYTEEVLVDEKGKFKGFFQTASAAEIVHDEVNCPSHYVGNIECIEAMIQQFGTDKTASFCLLNAFKYLWRCDKKHDTPIQDIKKAIWYLNKYIELYENEKQSS